MNRISSARFTILLLLTLLFPPILLLADQVEMQNGDRYFGNVLSLNSDSLVLQNEVLGTIRLPRAKVALVTFGMTASQKSRSGPTTTNNPVAASASANTNASRDFAALLGQLSVSSNLIQQVQSRFLSGAGTEANAQFNDLLNGLMTGKLNMSDLRVQAKSAADQLRAAKKDLGDEAGWGLDAYLAILDHFLKETAPPGGSPVNSAAPPPKPKVPAEAEE
jgi:hypothetical protein